MARDLNADLIVGHNSTKHPDVIEFAGDYSLRDMLLINHEGQAIDIK
jgi:hypothetical protein